MTPNQSPVRQVDRVWNVMAHVQKPYFIFQRNGRVHLNRRGRQFSRLLAAKVWASVVIMLDTPCSEEVWGVLATHSIASAHADHSPPPNADVKSEWCYIPLSPCMPTWFWIQTYYYYRYSALGPVWAETRAQSTGIALVRCILGKFLGVVCHCFPPPLDVPIFATRCLDARDPSGGRWNCGWECCPVILPKWRLPRHLGIFYMPQIYDVGPTALLPLRRKACWGFFRP